MIYISIKTKFFIDCFVDRTDGWGKSPSENSTTISADLLANGSQSAYFHEFLSGTDEYGREMETAKRLRTCMRRISVSKI